MNKNLFKGMFAALSLLLVTSCSEEDFKPDNGKDVNVSFSIGVENKAQSRAISDGLSVDQLTYAVFNNEGKMLGFWKDENDPTKFVAKTIDTDKFKTAGGVEEVTIALAKGQTYKVAFWAQNKACTAYDLTDFPNVKVSYTDKDGGYMPNNDESRDAFFAMKEITVTDHATIDVALTRPFAQINVGVTNEDWNAAITSERTIKTSKAVIGNAATKIDLLTGNVSEPVEVVYDFAAIPKSANPGAEEVLKVDLDNDGTPENYHYLSMSYILVNDANTGGAGRATLETLEYTFHSNDNQQDIDFKDGLNNVPVQRNWRTNIVGQILSGNIRFKIKVEPGYDGEDKYTNFQQVDGAPEGVMYDDDTNTYGIPNADGLEWAKDNIFSTPSTTGRTTTGDVAIVLLGNIDMTGEDWSLLGNNSTTGFSLDGNGYTISNWNVTTSNALFVPKSSASFTIKNLTLTDCSVISSDPNKPVALFVAEPIDGTGNLIFENCNVDNCIIKNTSQNKTLQYAGAFVAYAQPNTAENIEIINCSLKNSEINSFNSCGGFVGHDGVDTKIVNAVVTKCQIKNNESIEKSGIVIGTITETDADVTTLDVSNNNVFNVDQSGAVFGRIVNGQDKKGTLILDGISVTGNQKDGVTYSIASAKNLATASEKYFKFGGTFDITANIDMSGVEYKVPTGFNSSTLVINGNNYAISNLYVDSNFAALIGGDSSTQCNLTISDLTIKDSEFVGTETAAPFVGWLAGPMNLTNCHSVNNILKDANIVAGLVAYTTFNSPIGSGTDVKFDKCVVDGNRLYGTNRNGGSYPHIAGLVGQINKGSVSNCAVKNTSLTYNSNLNISSGQWCVGAFVATPQTETVLGEGNSVSNVYINNEYINSTDGLLGYLNATAGNWDASKIELNKTTEVE